METNFNLFKEIIEQSQIEKRGLTVYLKGQSLVGVVTKLIETEAFEMRSQMFDKIIVRIDAVDAIAIS